MSESYPPIEAFALEKVFRDFWYRPMVRAVKGVDFTLADGEVFGLLGPNGSGKSTIVKMVMGLLFPTRGQVAVYGRSPRDVETKNRIGLLPEETYLYPYLNAGETLDMYGRILGLGRSERKRRIDALVDMVGLTGARRRPLGQYSKGMARRLGIAQALIGDPDLVILDEPTTGLDPIGTREVKDMILDLKQRGKTVLLCSHLLADVEDICDRIAIMYAGKIRTLGTVRELLARRQEVNLTVPQLKQSTLDKVRKLIAEEEGSAESAVEVSHPMERLENFFLQVVEDASKVETDISGATIGDMHTSRVFGPGPEKPKEKSREEILGELTSADRPVETPVEKPAPTEDEETIDRGVLGRLAGAPEKPADEPAEPAGTAESPDEPQATQTPKTEVRRDLLDKLTGKRDDEEKTD